MKAGVLRVWLQETPWGEAAGMACPDESQPTQENCCTNESVCSPQTTHPNGPPALECLFVNPPISRSIEHAQTRALDSTRHMCTEVHSSLPCYFSEYLQLVGRGLSGHGLRTLAVGWGDCAPACVASRINWVRECEGTPVKYSEWYSPHNCF